ncbi:MAG: 50S ribosomal protein L11 methyltransferase [Deltaproteobacteria bacterium]|nr:50S ribosomal protein L11 methyltransferase [Deltaproteobacteria bacterium]
MAIKLPKFSPGTLLYIYELKIKEGQDRFADLDLLALLGDSFAGYHLEIDFAFVFCLARVDLKPLFAALPGTVLKEEHILRYDQWQDGVGSKPIVIGPLCILPAGNSHSLTTCDSVSGAASLLGFPKRLAPIYIDPALAFGYGGHATTKACLSFLVRIMGPQNTFIPETFLDLGCGTGVLSIAAVALGGKSALGVDYSHLAAQCALANRELNQMEDKISFVHGLAADYAKYKADVLLANIPLFVHLELLEKGAYLSRSYLILSGLLPKEADELKGKLSKTIDFVEVDNHRDDRWSSCLLKVK